MREGWSFGIRMELHQSRTVAKEICISKKNLRFKFYRKRFCGKVLRTIRSVRNIIQPRKMNKNAIYPNVLFNILKIVFKVNDRTDREIQRLCRLKGTVIGQVQAVEKVFMFYTELFLTTYLTCRWLCVRESLHLDQRLFSQNVVSASIMQMTSKEV